MGCCESTNMVPLNQSSNLTTTTRVVSDDRNQSFKKLPKGKTFLLKRINVSNNQKDFLKFEVELYIKITGNSNQGTKICLKMDYHSVTKDLGKTEECQKSDNEYSFATTFLVDYFFESKQDITFSIESFSNEIDSRQITLGNIMGSRNNTVKYEINGYQVEVNGKKVVNNKENISFNLSNKGLNRQFNTRNCFYIISNKNDGNNWRRVYKSEERAIGSNFDQMEIESSVLCLGDLEKSLLIQMIESSSGNVLDFAEYSINNLISNETIQYNSGIICPGVVKVTKCLDFVDYLQQGLQINLVVGVDFTGSNGDPKSSSSLHYLDQNRLNQYELSMSNCCSILSYYDYDKKFPLLGFGAIPQGMYNVEHVFPLNFNYSGSCEVSSLDEMLNVYRNAVNNVQLYGPTNFAPLINNTCNMAQSIQSKCYIVLLILTDGEISDFDDTVTSIIKASKLPISIVIIGVGNANFKNMENLDGDEFPLSNGSGVVERDIVQFVEFKKYNNTTTLAEEVLREIPRQVENYFRGKNVFN